jgi:hypothetical protein
MGAVFIFAIRNGRHVSSPGFQITQPTPYDCGKITVLRALFFKVNLSAVSGMYRRYPF